MQQSQGTCHATVLQELIMSKQECLQMSQAKNIKEIVRSLRYSREAIPNWWTRTVESMSSVGGQFDW